MVTDAKTLDWSAALYDRWWARMAEIFGRNWIEQFGAKPTESWREELSSWSVQQAAAVLGHYRRAGLQFPPTLSQVGKLARELKPALEALPPQPRRDVSLNVVQQRLAARFSKDEEWISRYRKEHGNCSRREAALQLMHNRGHVHLLPGQVLAEATAEEARALRRGASADVAATEP